MDRINLLPEELKPSGNIAKLDNTIRKLSFFLFFLLILISLLGGGVYVFLFYQNRLLHSENIKLKSEVLALETTEKKLFFLKDRVKKISAVFSVKDVSDPKFEFEQILERIDRVAKINKFELSENTINLEVTFRDAVASENFVKYLKESGNYRRIILANYNITDFGYSVAYNLFLK